MAEKKPTDSEIEARVDACIHEVMEAQGQTSNLASPVTEKVFADTIPTDRQLRVMRERIAYWQHPESRPAEETGDEALTSANLAALLVELADGMKPGEARAAVEEAARCSERGDHAGSALKLYLAVSELWAAVRAIAPRP